MPYTLKTNIIPCTLNPNIHTLNPKPDGASGRPRLPSTVPASSDSPSSGWGAPGQMSLRYLPL